MTNGKTLQLHYYLGQLISIINKNVKNKSGLKDVTVKNVTTNSILTTVKTVSNILLIGIEISRQSLSNNEKPGIISLAKAKELVKAIDACPEGCVLLIKETGPNEFETLVIPDIENARNYLKTNKGENLIFIAEDQNMIVTEEDNKDNNNKDNNSQKQDNQERKDDYKQTQDNQERKRDYKDDAEYRKMVEHLLNSANKQERAENVITWRDIFWKLAKSGTMLVGAGSSVYFLLKGMIETIRDLTDQSGEAIKSAVTSLYTAVTGNPPVSEEDLTTIINQLSNMNEQIGDTVYSGTDVAITHTMPFNLFGTVKNFLTEWFSITNALGDQIFGKASATGDVVGLALGIFGLFAVIALSARLFRSLFRIGFKESYVIREAEQQQQQRQTVQVTQKQRKLGLFAAVSVILVALFTKLTSGLSLLGKIASMMLSGVLNMFSKKKTEAINLKEMFVQIKEFLKALFKLIPATAITIIGAFLRFAKGGLVGIVNFIKRHEKYNVNTITADDKKVALELGMKTSVLAK